MTKQSVSDEAKVLIETALEGIISGWHFVNRFGYVITEVPCPEGLSITVEDEEDKVLEDDSDVTN